ncbi:ARM repeat-containing protein [Ceratobasidium sp. AG-I]|nr:ARM repeat-containing protein [Ceratobasidium sp. AG-I]
MPREHRKRGKKKKGNADVDEPAGTIAHTQDDFEPEQPQVQWMHTNDEPNLDAPFGYVEADVKAYFRTVDAKIQDWQTQDQTQELVDEEGNTNEDKRMFLVAALSESSNKERQLATDPDCAIILERMLHSMGDFIKRVFADRLSGSYDQLARHRFGSHVCQTLFEMAAPTVSRETRGRIAKPPDSDTESGVLRTMTELVLAISEELLPSLSQLILDPFAAHVILSLLILLSPTISQNSDSSKSRTSFVRSKKSAAYKSRQGPMKSILDSGAEGDSAFLVPSSFQDVAGKFVDALRDTLDANEVRALAADKVANPVLQAMLALEAQQGRSDTPGSLIDSILMGTISALDQNRQPEHSDYLETLLRDPTASHIFEALIQHAPERAIQSLWSEYFKGKLPKLSSHPVANFVVGKAIARLDANSLLEATQEVDPVASKLIKTARTGVLKSLVDRATALGVHEETINETLCRSVDVGDDDIRLLVPCLLTLKSAKVYTKALESADAEDAKPDRLKETSTDPVEPTVQGAILLQSMLRLPEPHNQPVIRSIQSQEVNQLIKMSRHPVSSRVLDVLLESPSVSLRDKRKFLMSLMGHYHTLVDDRIGSRVGDRCWTCADPFLKERIAKSILPHEGALAASYYGKYFARNLHLTMLKRDPTAWRDMQRNQKAAATQPPAMFNSRTPTADKPILPQDSAAGTTKKRKRPATETDEIDLLFSKTSHVGKSILPTESPIHASQDIDDSPRGDKSVPDVELKEVLGAIKKVSKKEGMRKSRRT